MPRWVPRHAHAARCAVVLPRTPRDDAWVSVVGSLLSLPSDDRFWLWRIGSMQEAGSAIEEWREAGLVVRTVRGRKMRDVASLDDEFAAALQFPWYFGENWAALSECICDLSWLPPGAGYVLVVSEPLFVLDREPGALVVLARILQHAVREWMEAVELGEWWDRAPVAFGVVLACESGDVVSVEQKWTGAGATLAPLT